VEGEPTGGVGGLEWERRMVYVLTCLNVPNGASSPTTATYGGAYLITTLLGLLASFSSPRRGLTRTVMLIYPPLNFVTSHLPSSEVEFGIGAYIGPVGIPKTSSKAPLSRNPLKSKSSGSEVDPLLRKGSELVSVSISVFEDGVDGVNDNIRDGSRSDPGLAIRSGASR